MSTSRLPSFAGVASFASILSALLSAHCDNPDTCSDRGNPQTYTGSEQYVGTLAAGDAGAGAGIFGSGPRAATVDWEPYFLRHKGGTYEDPCSKYDVPLAVTVGKCTLHGTLTSTKFDSSQGGSGGFISATASLDAGQTCEIPVSGGTATIALDSGHVEWDDLQTTTIIFSGNVAQWLGSPAPSGYLTYTFKGSK